ncbi:hypothetical protein L0337_25870 [candidate division KSB1 bacterium]|nr:hypothetical protein [candidate division KSB1 bacterium]
MLLAVFHIPKFFDDGLARNAQPQQGEYDFPMFEIFAFILRSWINENRLVLDTLHRKNHEAAE